MHGMKKNITLSLIASLLISAGALYLAFRNVPFTALLEYFADINYFWIIPSFGLAVLSFIFRALRWRIIVGSTRDIGFWSAFHPLMIAFMINCILPGRVGEIARPVILKKKENIPFATGLATVAAERTFDVILLMLLFMIVMLFVQIDPDIKISFGKYQLDKSTLETIASGMVRLSLAMVAGIILISFEKIRNFIARMLLKLPSLFIFVGKATQRRLAGSLCHPAIRLMENFAAGFRLIRSPLNMLTCAALSVLIWALAASSYYVFSIGCPGVQLGYAEMTAVMVIICIFIALPSVPGYWGLWEAGGMFAMTLFGVPAKEAAGFTLANHAIQVFPVILVGIASAIITGVNIKQASYGPEGE